nr:uncharacterized protein LOC129385392 [Dermacentor andersoni]
MLASSDKPDNSQRLEHRGTSPGLDHGGPRPVESGGTSPRSAADTDALLQYLADTPPGERSGRVTVTVEKRSEDRPESPALATPSTSPSPTAGQQRVHGERDQDTAVTRHSDKHGHSETRQGHRPRRILRKRKANVAPPAVALGNEPDATLLAPDTATALRQAGVASASTEKQTCTLIYLRGSFR